MKYKKVKSMMATILVAFAMVSCSSGTVTEDGKVAENSEVINGEKIVVATSVAVTEILDALGVKVSGVPTTSYELPESTVGATEVGNPMSPDLEIIKSLNPTVVVSVDTLGSDYIELFSQNNIPSEFVSLESLEGLKETIKALGERFEKNEEAQEILDELQTKEETISEETKDIEKPELLVLFAAPGSTMIATSKSYIGNLVEMVGGANIIKENNTSFVTLNKEYIATLNPEKILVMTHALPEQTRDALQKEMETDSMWQRIEAVQQGKVIYLDNNYFGMSANLKVIEGLDILKDVVHSEGK